MVLLLGGTVSAQLKKGDWQVSGSYTYDFTKSKLFDHQKDTKEDTYSYRIAPAVEYFISNRFSVGISPFWQETNYDFQGADSGIVPELNNEIYMVSDYSHFYLRDIGLEAMVKYYLPIGTYLFFTAKGYLSYSFSGNSNHQGTVTYRPEYISFHNITSMSAFENEKFGTLSLGITPGFTFLCKRVGIHLYFLPVSYVKSVGDKFKITLYRTTPYLSHEVVEDYLGNIISEYDLLWSSKYDFERTSPRRKNDFDINWASFSLGVSYRF